MHGFRIRLLGACGLDSVRQISPYGPIIYEFSVCSQPSGCSNPCKCRILHLQWHNHTTRGGIWIDWLALLMLIERELKVFSWTCIEFSLLDMHGPPTCGISIHLPDGTYLMKYVVSYRTLQIVHAIYTCTQQDHMDQRWHRRYFRILRVAIRLADLKRDCIHFAGQ